MAAIRKTLAPLALTAGLLAGAAAPVAASNYYGTTSGVTCNTTMSTTCTFSFFMTNPVVTVHMTSFMISISETSPWRFASGGYGGFTIANPDHTPSYEFWSATDYQNPSDGGFRTIVFDPAAGGGSSVQYGFTFDVTMVDAQAGPPEFSYSGVDPHGLLGPALATPEPVTLLLLGSGLAGVAGAARRRRKYATGLDDSSVQDQRSTATNSAPRGTL